MATQGNNLWTHLRRSPDSDRVNDLLKLAIEGHGGMPRWNQISRFRVVASITGAIWALKGMPGLLDGVVLEGETRDQRLTITPFPQSGIMVPTRRRVYVRNPDGSPIRDSVSLAIDVAHVAFS